MEFPENDSRVQTEKDSEAENDAERGKAPQRGPLRYAAIGAGVGALAGVILSVVDVMTDFGSLWKGQEAFLLGIANCVLCAVAGALINLVRFRIERGRSRKNSAEQDNGNNG